jgi:FdhD protein
MVSKILKEVKYTLANSGFATASERICRETVIEINVNGRHFSTATILAALEKEFVTGHLFTQGIIRSAADINSMTIKNNTAEVSLAKACAAGEMPRSVASELKVSRGSVFECVRAILKSEIFTETEAVHSAGLFLEGKETIFITEDLGRHHALDKVIGAGLLRGTDFRRTVAASTGRQPSEMIYKCLRAGIPVIATKGVPTTLAIEIAEKAGITIAGLVRGDTMFVYTHPERVV